MTLMIRVVSKKLTPEFSGVFSVFLGFPETPEKLRSLLRKTFMWEITKPSSEFMDNFEKIGVKKSMTEFGPIVGFH